MNENQMNEITQQIDGGITPTEVEYDEFAGTSVQGTEPMATLDGGQEELIEVPIEEVEQALGVEMIETEPMTDATEGGIEVNHALLYNREAENQHPIGAITGLSKRLESIEAVKRVYGKGSSYAEFRKWQDSNPAGADRSGYFVYIAPNSDTIEICDEAHEVYGVTTSDAAFVGNQVDSDRSDDWAYAMVSLIGAVKVRTDGTARVGEYVVPNEYGEATLAENNYGYKVLSLGSYSEYNYAVIALVPQSSALNKILGSLSGGELDIGGLLIEIDGLKGSVNDALDKSQIAIDTSNMSKDEIAAILGELNTQKQQITDAQTALSETQAQAEQAEATASEAQNSAATAAHAAQSAKEEAIVNANQALSEMASLQESMKDLVEWRDPETGAYGVAGFVAQANADHTTLATIVAGGDSEGTDLSAIKQTKDIIQHLVSHMDRYAVGELSLSYGLSAEEADEILTEEYIYVATSDHEEEMGATTFTFKRGYAYTWNPETDTWTETAEISTATEYKPGTAVGDLWYCWQPGITQTDENGEIITTYDVGTLYRWYGSEWIAVATMADNYQSRITSSVKQTADSLQSDVVALDGSVSTMSQKVDGFTTRVADAEGNISSMEQTVSEMNSTIADVEGKMSSIQQKVTDNEASIDMINTGRFHVAYQSFLEVAPPAEGDKYSQPPMWDDVTESFVFNDTYVDNTDGKYYFINEDHTKYCHVTTNGYDIYTIGNKATALIHSRIDDTESRIDLLAEFDTQTSESLAGLTARADENEAEIDLVASRYDHIRLSVSADEVPMYGTYKYTKPPTWNGSTGKYEFNIDDRSDDGTYYMADEDGKTYCNAVTAADGTVLYETYGLAGGSVTALQQKVDENSASIGMVVDKDGVKGSAIVEAINGESTATINADKIKLTGTDEISLAIQGAADKMPFTVTLTATSQMFVQTANTNVYTPSTITLTAVPSGEVTSYRWWCNNALMVEYNNKNTVSISYASIAVGSTTFKVECTNSDGQTCSDVISIAKLNNGQDGTDGSDGRGVVSITNYYAKSESDTVAPTKYTSSIPTLDSTYKYLWGWEAIKYTDGTTTGTPQRIISMYSEDGKDGVGISSIEEHYALSTSNETVTGTWQDTVPMLTPENKYLWNYETINYTEGESFETAQRVIGVYGDTGADGQNGKDGADGSDGIDGYTILLSNEYVEIPVYANSKPKESHTITSTVSVYKGATKLTGTTDTVTSSTFKINSVSAPNGLTVTKTADTVTIQIGVTKAIADLNEVVLTITLYGGLTLTAVIKVRANMNNREAIVSLINQTDDTVTIRAENIDLMGYVTFSDLTTDTTTISGPNISCYNGQFSLRSGTSDNYTEVITLDSDGSLVVNNKSSNVIINDDGLICYNNGFSLRSGTPDSYTEVMRFDTNWGFTLTGAIYQATNYGHFLLWNGVAQWGGTSNFGSLAYYPDTGGMQLTSSTTLQISALNAMTLTASVLRVPNQVQCLTDGQLMITSWTADGSNYGMLSMLGSDINLTTTNNLNLTCTNNIGKITLSATNRIELKAQTTCTITGEYLEITGTTSCTLTCDSMIAFRSSTAGSVLGIQYIAEGYSNGAYMLGTGCSLILNAPNLFFMVGGTQYWLYFSNGYVRYNT